jgi:hypothetical protein
MTLYHAISLPARLSVLPSVYFCLSVLLSSGISTVSVRWIYVKLDIGDSMKM